MNALTRVRTAWQVLRGTPATMERKKAPFIWPAWVDGRPKWQITDFNSYVTDGFNRNSLIYSAIMYKVRAVSTVPLRAYDGSSEKPQLLPDNHYLARLCKRPNPYQSGQQFMGLNTVYLNISGNSYVMLDRAKTNEPPTAMYSLRPDRVFIIPGNSTELSGSAGIRGYLYVPEGRSYDSGIPILPEDMMHVKLPNPADPLEGMGYGLSPFAAMSQSADVDNAVTTYLKLFFQRGAAPNIYLKFNADLDDETAGKARNRFMEMYGGYENWIGPAVMDNGGEISQFGQNFKEMGFEAIDDRNESRVLGPFGVPGILIGTRLGVNRAINANAVELRKQFWEDTMLPELSGHEMEYQYKLEQPNGEFVAFDTSGVPALQKDKASAVSAFAQLVNIGIPKQTAASFLDIEFGSELEDGDVVYMPSSLKPIGGQAPQIAGQGQTEGQELTAGATDSQVSSPGEKPLNLNGAQVQAVMSIIQSVSSGTISQRAAISMLRTMFGINEAQAIEMFDAVEAGAPQGSAPAKSFEDLIFEAKEMVLEAMRG